MTVVKSTKITLADNTASGIANGELVRNGALLEYHDGTSSRVLVNRDLAETLTNKTLTSPTLTFSINSQTGTTYTPVLADTGKIITCSNGSAITFTIPPNSSVAYPIGSSLTVISIGAGLTTIGQGVGVTIASTGAVATAPVLRIQHSSATAIKIATDTWQVVGDIS